VRFSVPLQLHNHFYLRLFFTIYPNPVFNSITIQSEKVVTGVKVFTILGALVQEVKTNANNINLI
jgi:hypothetical protein